MKYFRHLYKSLRDNFNLLRQGKYYDYDLRKIIKQLNISQFQPYDEIRNQQLKDLKCLLNNCDLSYYEKSGNSAILFENILNQSISITKGELRENFNKLYKPSSKEYTRITSGSTGQPLHVIISNISAAHRAAHFYRFCDWWEIRPWDRHILIWGQLSVDSKEKVSLKKKLKRFIKRLIIKPDELFINVFELNEHAIYQLYNQCLKHKAKYIRGYASGVYQFCYLLKKQGIDGKKLGLQLAIVTSEILFNDRRNFIEETLGCKVANEYGAVEIGFFACECPEGSMHILEELNLLQTKDDGTLLVTNIHNTCTPLLNYVIGDKIKISNKLCSCGRGLRVIDEIIGREGDLIKRPNGEYVSQYVFYYALKDMEAMSFQDSIAQYKVIQEENLFTVFFVKGSNFKTEAVTFFIDRMKKEIGNEISVNIEYVKDIPKEKSGKIRFFQRINSNHL